MFTKDTGLRFGMFYDESRRTQSLCLSPPEIHQPSRVCQELLGITTENSRVDLFVTAHCDSLITQSDILLLSSSLKGASGTFSHSQSSGKWCAALNVSALRFAGWNPGARAALGTGKEHCAPEACSKRSLYPCTRN